MKDIQVRILIPTCPMFRSLFPVVMFLLLLAPVRNLCGQEFVDTDNSIRAARPAHDIMDTRNMRLIDYRRMFENGTTPTPADLVGTWRGVNKGVVEWVGYKQFIKEIQPNGSSISGDNFEVYQVDKYYLREYGWEPNIDEFTGQLQSQGKFAIEPPRGKGTFQNGVVFSYRRGDNRRLNPVRLLVDKVVKIDDNHLLGRATANFGPVQIPLSYFVLERM